MPTRRSFTFGGRRRRSSTTTSSGAGGISSSVIDDSNNSAATDTNSNVDTSSSTADPPVVDNNNNKSSRRRSHNHNNNSNSRRGSDSHGGGGGGVKFSLTRRRSSAAASAGCDHLPSTGEAQQQLLVVVAEKRRRFVNMEQPTMLSVSRLPQANKYSECFVATDIMGKELFTSEGIVLSRMGERFIFDQKGKPIFIINQKNKETTKETETTMAPAGGDGRQGGRGRRKEEEREKEKASPIWAVYHSDGSRAMRISTVMDQRDGITMTTVFVDTRDVEHHAHGRKRTLTLRGSLDLKSLIVLEGKDEMSMPINVGETSLAPPTSFKLFRLAVEPGVDQAALFAIGVCYAECCRSTTEVDEAMDLLVGGRKNVESSMMEGEFSGG